MIDPNLLKYNSDLLCDNLRNKGFVLNIKIFQNLEYKRKKRQINIENLRSKYNFLSKQFKYIKKNIFFLNNLKLQIFKIKNLLIWNNKKLNIVKKKINKFLLSIPNIIDITVPHGKDFHDNKIINIWGKVKTFHFKICDHVDLGNKNNGLDWITASKISSSGFVFMNNKLAWLHRILGQFMLDIHTKKHGYIETYIPYLVNKKSMYGTGQLPKFKEELFYVSTIINQHKVDKYILIPTAEVSLTNLFSNKIINSNNLPVMLTAYSPCFRAESLSYGVNNRGLVRMHQFDKVEILQMNTVENAMESLEQVTHHAEVILQLLDLPYRKVLLCSGDTGFAACKTYDLEVWFPSENKYREISSCSNMSDFQSRRIKAKYFKKNIKKKFFLHTINGSGLAIGRTLAAILENYQCSNGKIKIPDILRKYYMNGIEFI
ncbi:Serine--tRNA ligase [Buchnera aphidicola (Pterocallis alni)]|uniref:serine--tRNA ligase n=1 Tax=Buchnera aphidicola TaxID=9 RepID=UPI00346483EA